MTCARCGAEADGPTWCAACEAELDAWSRRHASDIVWSALSGAVVVVTVAMGIPLLGAPFVTAVAGVFGGFATIVGVHRWSRRRRRAQFLAGAAVPRAYLADPRDS